MEKYETEMSSHKMNVSFQSQSSRAASSSPCSTHSNASMSSDSNALSNDSKTQEKICVVCGDTATGTHFAAMTCEGCKGFFRRSMKKCSQFSCAFENQCAINKSNRKHCQACRLQKCLSVGMNSNLIMSDESVNRKRELIRANREKKELLRRRKEQEEVEREKKLESSPNPTIPMMAEDKDLIQMMLESHNQSYDFDYDDYESFRGRQHIHSPNPEDVKRTHVTLAWLMTGNSDKDLPMPENKNDPSKKPTMETYDDEHLISKKIKPEFASPKETMCEQPKPVSGEMVDMFSTLHGVSQPINRGMNASVSSSGSQRHESYYSDTSGSSSSVSPSYIPPKSSFPIQDPFSAFDQASCNMMPMFGGDGDASALMGSTFDSMSYLQGLFMNPESFDGKSHSLFLHFCDIMTWGIKKVIEFCKCIPEFQELSTVDQINLLRGGCLEMLVLRSYFAFASDGNKYMSEKFQYSPNDFLQAGASSEFIEQYLKVHMRMRKMKLKVEEICLLIGLVLFSPDRPGVQDCEKVEQMQKRIAQALRAYEYTHNDPDKACIIYSELLLLLPVLRTINVLFSNTILTLKSGNEDDMNPLILEVNN